MGRRLAHAAGRAVAVAAAGRGVAAPGALWVLRHAVGARPHAARPGGPDLPRLAANLAFLCGEHALPQRVTAAPRPGRAGRLQIAGLPLRQAPGQGELHPPHRLARVDELGHDGFTGCGYRPAAGPSAGPGWLTPYRNNEGDIA